MHPKLYFLGLALVAFLALGGVASLIIYFDPRQAGWLILLLFYFTLLVGLTFLFAWFGLLAAWLSGNLGRTPSAFRLHYRLAILLRRGFLLSFILVIGLFLQSQGWLNWWSLLILVLLVVLIEWRVSRH